MIRNGRSNQPFAACSHRFFPSIEAGKTWGLFSTVELVLV
jgi:hypothetical protein